MQNLLKLKNSTIENELREITSKLSDIFCSIKKHPRVYREETWARFRTYDSKTQEDCLNKANTYLEICQSTLNSGSSLTNTKQMLWYAVRRLKLLPSDDLFEVIQENDVVEIYNSNGVQLFRNHRFFDICSYDFAELFIYPWYELYKRDNSVDEQIMFFANKIFSGEHKTTIAVSNIPYHKMQEIFSPEKFIMEMQEKYFSPLKPKSGSSNCTVAISNVRVVGKATSDRAEWELPS